ncbi:MAG: ATP-binding protein [Gammaproteobacteria bacterium]
MPLLRRQAPTWLLQMPGFLEEAELDMLSRQVYGATAERMARELAEAFEVLTAESPLVLWLEDLHWSDLSTVDLLAMLARRREPAHLLVVGTYRPADVIASGHPLRGLVRELQAHAQCAELPLRFLTAPEVTQYLAARFALPESQAARLEEWGRFVHRHTDGNPLFMITMVDDLMGQGVIGEAALEQPWPAPPINLAGGLPESLRQLIDHQLDRLRPEERRVLEAASVAGMEFSTAMVATALETDVLMVECCSEALASRHLFLGSTKGSPEGPTGPNRRLSERYRFLHALYPQTVGEGWPAARRRRLHQQVGLSKEAAFGSRGARRAFRGSERRPLGGALSRAGGAECASAIRWPGGERSSYPGARAPTDSARDARACPTRAVTANEPRGGIRDDPGPYGPTLTAATDMIVI